MISAEVDRAAGHGVHAHCHEHQHQQVAFPRLMEVLSKVSLVGLAVLAGCTSLSLFVPAFAVGALYGLYDSAWVKEPLSKAANFSGCSQGFWEDLTGVAFPAPVALLAGVAGAAVHIDHHADVFVPLAGFAAGLWVGSGCALCCRQFRQLVAA